MFLIFLERPDSYREVWGFLRAIFLLPDSYRDVANEIH
ncbi:hypothetical protein FSS13T_24030 [Flavobacterium saliperosum S13]|uniref:Transposase n=1 Tax=Flavobacterium saliperosum S13 TaxID=1341155 RepID=A0ABN0QDS6_9FLAO|nr:hypothetical protein FSS13T_24030 [Flavobacterium saliperosum S13]